MRVIFLASCFVLCFVQTALSKTDKSIQSLSVPADLSKKLECLSSLQEVAQDVSKGAYRNKHHAGPISANCYWCGNQSPKFSRPYIWNRNGQSDVMLQFPTAGDFSKARIIEYPKLTPSPSGRRQVCLKDTRGNTISRAFTLQSRTGPGGDKIPTYAYDNDPIMSIGCGPAPTAEEEEKRRKRRQNPRHKGYTNDVIQGAVVVGDKVAPLVQEFTASVDADLEEALKTITYEGLKTTVESRKDWRRAPVNGTYTGPYVVSAERIGDPVCQEVLSPDLKAKLSEAKANAANLSDWATRVERAEANYKTARNNCAIQGIPRNKCDATREGDPAPPLPVTAATIAPSSAGRPPPTRDAGPSPSAQ